MGISEKTYYRWVQRGTKALWLEEKGKKVPESEKIYRNLRNAIKKAIAEAEIRNILIVQKAGEKNWQAAMTWLERKYPQRWARRDKLEVKTKKTIESKQFIEISKKVELLLPEQRKQLITLAIKAEEEFMKSNANDGDNKNE